MSGLDYDYVSFKGHWMKGSPKGKMPWIRDPQINGGLPLGDSHFIIRELKNQGRAPRDIDAWLSAEELAVATAFRVMLEESVYFGLLQARWISQEFDRVTVNAYFGEIVGMPVLLRRLLGYSMFRPKISKQMYYQGLGLHSDTEIVEKIGAEIRAVSRYLGKKHYLMGEKPSSVDATVYSFIVVFLQGDWQHGIRNIIQNDCVNLVSYVNRMRKEFFPELITAS
eukprot:TRINITY_DN6642_c0_g5_i1.p1 TRINITY_DN6642_c0_g5~~TRINITY_DN6642_c0_g5_i1.p1  ORF type:complete len:224 (-),score=32.11 TRINITY_DN6642_c0_g5_i1:84-755(-)